MEKLVEEECVQRAGNVVGLQTYTFQVERLTSENSERTRVNEEIRRTLACSDRTKQKG